MFMFKRTSLPVARSIHYQLIDIQLDDVQQMIHSNDNQVRAKKNACFSSLRGGSDHAVIVPSLTPAVSFPTSLNTPVGSC